MDVSRSRDQRPCDNCRRRKIRCLFASSEAINCVLCESRSTVCTYVQSAPRKKRPLSSNDDTPRAGQTGSRPKQRLRPGSKDDTVVKDYASLKGQSLLKETLGHQNRQSSAIIGATTDFDPSLTHALSWNAKGECPSFQAQHILRRANQNVHFVMRPDTQDEMDAELTNLDAIEDFVSPHGPELVNLYFRIVHPSFPILHKKVFLEKYGRSYPCALQHVETRMLMCSESKVLKMLFEVHKRPKISDLQGGLVLMQSPNVSSWALAGHLIAMAQNLGMNFDCSDWQVPDWERGVRKRVAWALFMQDKWGALVYGRGSLLRADDWDVQPLTASDFPETSKDDDLEEGSAEIEKGKQTFLHMVSLTEIVADILDQFFTLRATRRRQTIEQVLESAKPLQLRLKAWLTSLPTDLSVGDTVPRKLSSVGYLHLAYYTAEITLHRAILRSHSMASPAPDLYAITRLAASTRFTSALDFVKRLKAEHLQSFWYFSSGLSLAIIGLFAGILCMTSQDREGAEREALLGKLAELRWFLRINSPRGGVYEIQHRPFGREGTNFMEQQVSAARGSFPGGNRAGQPRSLTLSNTVMVTTIRPLPTTCCCLLTMATRLGSSSSSSNSSNRRRMLLSSITMVSRRRAW
ncbi:transcriptional activator protein DAL81 [Verticillium alfalfae VaMs.102]|uniref:Transcriptional activator protein DAL81 n=1 Tax=Verticillium alfalfae (strain VaMs.102 / ATCC MYA-4576 / FGSC 10136) TaxID=526221 RepID=C9S803_VERA1|nr:transcriptional activator protein DAL81 [Verticillium alfalfae VaMs.102]EEY15293.1 transcriptional activator protein DAL81 [Verticillium alfalfae VaMs.102]